MPLLELLALPAVDVRFLLFPHVVNLINLRPEIFLKRRLNVLLECLITCDVRVVLINEADEPRQIVLGR